VRLKPFWFPYFYLNRAKHLTLKVAFILTHFDTGGAERIVLSLLQRLDRKQFSPSLVLLNPEGRLLADLPADVSVIPLGKSKSRKAIFSLRDVFQREKFDACYSVTNAMNLLVLTAATLAKSPPKTIVSDHTPLKLYLRDKKFHHARTALIKYLYGRADRLCAPVQDICDEYVSLLGVAAEKTRVLDNPVLETGVQPNLKPDLVDKLQGLPRPIVMSIGRLSVEKGTDILINSFAKVHAKAKCGSLVLFGDGDARQGLQDLAVELKVSENVYFLGNVPSASAYLNMGDVFALTSRREGFGNVLIEAMDARLPVLAVDCPFGPRRILEDGRLGLLVSKDDSEALDAGLLNIMMDKSYRDSFLEPAYLKAQQYDADVATRQFEGLLLELLLN